MPKGPSSFPKREPFDEDSQDNAKTTLETGWEDESSTTVAQDGEPAEKVKALVERAHNAEFKTGVTSTNAGLDEPTVDDQRAKAALGVPQIIAARLVITAGNDTGNVLSLKDNKTYTIGRAVDNDLVLTDIAVSRKHFDLKHDAGAWVLVDRRSGNGTLVNGNIEDNAFMLANGDMIEIGNTTFRFEMPNGLPRVHAENRQIAQTASMDGSMDGSIDSPITPVRGAPLIRPQQQDDDDDDEDDEQSTVAGKPIRDQIPETPPPPGPRARPATNAPPQPPPPAPRLRPPTNAPPLPPPLHVTQQPTQLPPMPPAPGVMPYAVPSAATTLPIQQQGRPIGPQQPTMLAGQPPMLGAQQPTILGDAMGIPLAQGNNSTLPGAVGAPRYNPNPYTQSAEMLPPHLSHPHMNGGMHAAYVADYSGGMPSVPAYAPTMQRPSISRRTKMILGAVGLALAAAIATVLIIKAASDEPVPAPAKPTKSSATNTKPTKPTVEPIKANTTAPPPTKAPETAPIKPSTTTVAPPAGSAASEPATTVQVAPVRPTEVKSDRDKEQAAREAKEREAREAKAREEREAREAKAREEREAREAKAREEREAREAKARELAKLKKDKDREKPIVRDDPPEEQPRVAADTGGAKAKAEELYRAKSFSAAAKTLTAAAKGASDGGKLKVLAADYERFGKAYNVGMAPGTSAAEAYGKLLTARGIDDRAGKGAFASEINARLGEIAPRAAAAFMANKDYVNAKSALSTAESAGKSNSTTQALRASLESEAGKLFKQAQAEMGGNAAGAMEMLRKVQQMVDPKSPWYQKAGKLLAGG